MNKRIERCTLSAMMALGSMAIAGVLSTAQAALPPVKHQGSVQYVSGGIGIDESEAMKAAAKDYSLSSVSVTVHIDYLNPSRTIPRLIHNERT